MDFRNPIWRTSSDVDLSLDPASPDGTLPRPREQYQSAPETDGQDPATPGGPAPYNAATPLGEPVADDPLLPLPQHDPEGKVPYAGPGADVDITTLHGASRHRVTGTDRSTPIAVPSSGLDPIGPLLNSRHAGYENRRVRHT